MKIKGGKVKATVLSYQAKFVLGQGTVKRHVDLMVSRTQNQMTQMFGEEMTSAVFAAFITEQLEDEDGTSYTAGSWKLKNLQPSKRVVCEQHRVTLGEMSVQCEPIIRGFKPVDDETEKVFVIFRIPIGRAQKQQRRFLEDSCDGSEIDVKFEPTQTSLITEKGKARGAQMEIIKGGAASAQEVTV